jgi:ornithine decarboxylase
LTRVNQVHHILSNCTHALHGNLISDLTFSTTPPAVTDRPLIDDRELSEMPDIDILPASSAIHFTSDIIPRHAAEKLPWAIHSIPTTSPLFPSCLGERRVAPVDNTDDVVFDGLPPLLHGHPDLHLREGIMRAAVLAVDHEPDAEKAFFVADLSCVYNQHQRFKHLLPEVEPFYGKFSAMIVLLGSFRFIAVKCNPDPYVLRLLAGLGANFDCASNGEIANVLSTGVVEPSRIIFANPCKAASHLKQAARAGVDLMTFDNADELHKIARVHPSARLVLRILTDDSKALCPLGLKFGAPLASVPCLLAKARELELNVVGVSFHVGSGCYDSSAYGDAVARARVAFDMGCAAGFHFDLLDVGGGFEDHTFESTAATLRDAIDTHFPERSGLRIIAEPGRYYVSRAFSLAANIIARRAAADDAEHAAAAAIESDQQPSVMCTWIHALAHLG